MKPIIRVENLSKQYCISARQAPYQTLRESMVMIARSPINWFRRNGQPDKNYIWALKDITFDVMPGEVLGIIGRNGSGKSTLLKVLSRITEPTTGQVDLYGRVGSLLEVGTGFHSELSGRENIYLNGAILGMTRGEIQKKFDEIVAFSEIDQFLDTPVKHYSSGMYLRLAFAVAAHLDPEILIVDEVLSVGDAAFQQKCIGKMNDVRRSGRTVLFVSHNMAAVQNLCSNCILLERGRVEYIGPSYQAISRYYNEESARSTGQPQTIQALRTHRGRQPGMEVTMQEAWLTSDTINPVTDVAMGRPVGIHIRFHSHSAVIPTLSVVVKAVDGMPLFGLNNRMLRESRPIPALTQGVISMHMKSVPLMPGRYMIDLYFGNTRRDTDIILNAISLNVTPGDVYGTGSLPPASAGPMYVMACFRIEAPEVTVSYSANVQQSMV